ncbi:IS701 family transposase [Mycolicibacter icosiumassiliensis]|uniref:IS701 family transposase n=1 Tax=Mycolicibacter icosiumassiliensis TaxID=1792835 RepID=UPI0008302827|nr:IS701 family transposase [Mycolicibacter icosiumassiliensis]
MNRISGRFARYDAARNAGAFVLGVLSAVESKNCWTMAELSGHSTPDKLQHLLARAKWNADDIADELRTYVVEAFADSDAVLVVDETGDVKKGTKTVGVQRQYSGTAGRIENCQVAVYMTYTSSRGHALIDRALYLPKSWADDPDRCLAAGVPESVAFATKPALATAMIGHALDAGVPASWVAGDEVYGADPDLRTMLQHRGVGYVLAISCDRRVPTKVGSLRVDDLACALPMSAWQRRSAGAGAKGPRMYSWAWIATTESAPSGSCSVLIRRNDITGELAFYHCYSPASVPLAALVRVAGRRWTVEESFQTSKGLTCLYPHQVRTWTSWHRWTILVMLAHAFLAVQTATQRDTEHHNPALIRLSVNEFRRLFVALILTPLHHRDRILDWSLWRRRHQQQAYQSRQNCRSKYQ